MFRNKKALTEAVSFIFLTLLVVVISLSAFTILQNILEDNVEKIDRDNLETYLKTVKYEIDKISAVENLSTSVPLTFKSGFLIFEDNQLYYQSLVEYEDTTSKCFNDLCYVANGENEKIYFNLSGSYSFSENISLRSGSHTLTFINYKNENQIKVRIR